MLVSNPHSLSRTSLNHRVRGCNPAALVLHNPYSTLHSVTGFQWQVRDSSLSLGLRGVVKASSVVSEAHCEQRSRGVALMQKYHGETNGTFSCLQVLSQRIKILFILKIHNLLPHSTSIYLPY